MAKYQSSQEGFRPGERYNLWKALQNVCGFTALESDMDEICRAIDKDCAAQNPASALTDDNNDFFDFNAYDYIKGELDVTSLSGIKITATTGARYADEYAALKGKDARRWMDEAYAEGVRADILQDKLAAKEAECQRLNDMICDINTIVDRSKYPESSNEFAIWKIIDRTHAPKEGGDDGA